LFFINYYKKQSKKIFGVNFWTNVYYHAGSKNFNKIFTRHVNTKLITKNKSGIIMPDFKIIEIFKTWHDNTTFIFLYTFGIIMRDLKFFESGMLIQNL
jgi:hypothetical protein